MSKGLDTTANCTQHASALRAAGYTFVARYSSHSLWKNMTRAEVRALSDAGLYVVNVWESSGDHASFFTHAQGVQDGGAAFHFAQGIGQPAPAPIYFAVDEDLPGPGGVHEYFQGVRESLSAHGAIGKNVYNVGVYGSGDVCKYLSGIGYVSYTWLAQAMGWSGSRLYRDWNIKQGKATTVFGMNVDLDTASPKGGGGFQVHK